MEVRTGTTGQNLFLTVTKDSILKKGLLWKQGGFIKTWKERFFVLSVRNSGGPTPLYSFVYYKSDKSYEKRERPQGIIELVTATATENPTQGGRQFLFSVGIPSKRLYLISAKSNEERQDWLSKIRDAINVVNQRRTSGKKTQDEIVVAKPSPPATISPATSQQAAKQLNVKEDDFLLLVEQKHIQEANKKNEHEAQLQKAEREAKRLKAAIVIQKRYRGWIARKKYQKQKQRTIQVQSLIRGHVARNHFKITRKRIILLQSIWRAGVVRKLALTRKKNTQQRFKIIQEILSTEKSYVTSLQTVSDVFLVPLLQSSIVSSDTVRGIFSNIDFILQIHLQMVKVFEERVRKWYPYQIVADVFLKSMADFHAYTQYIKNFDKSTETIRKIETPAFTHFMEEVKRNPRCNLLELADFLIMPVQRYTDKDIPEYSRIEETLKQLRQITVFINDQKKAADSKERMNEIQKRLKGGKKKPLLLQKGRILLFEGTLLLLDVADQQATQVYVFLFNDLAMVSKQKNVRKRILFLEAHCLHIRSEPLVSPTSPATFKVHRTNSNLKTSGSPKSPNSKKDDKETKIDNMCFKLIDTRPNGGECIFTVLRCQLLTTVDLFQAFSQPEKTKWITELKNAIEDVKKKQPSEDEAAEDDDFEVDELSMAQLP